MPTTATTQLLDQLKNLAADFDDKQRKDLISSLNGVAISLETPQDAIQRVMYSVRNCLRMQCIYFFRLDTD
jgi:uncharacterized tellurite resistance protein B-like protein